MKPGEPELNKYMWFYVNGLNIDIDIENGRLHQLQTVFQQCPKQITYIYTIADYSRQSLCEVKIVVRGPNRNEQGCILQA